MNIKVFSSQMLIGLAALLIGAQAHAQQSASVSEKSARENRSQLEKSINEENSKEIQRQNGESPRVL